MKKIKINGRTMKCPIVGSVSKYLSEKDNFRKTEGEKEKSEFYSAWFNNF